MYMEFIFEINNIHPASSHLFTLKLLSYHLLFKYKLIIIAPLSINAYSLHKLINIQCSLTQMLPQLK